MKEQDLLHIKMMNGDDILAFTRDLGSHTEFYAPIIVHVDPHLGLFAKSWLLLSESNSVAIRKEHVIFACKASKRAVEYYEEFMHRIHERAEVKKMEEDSEFTNELEDIFTALAESKTATKN